MITVLGLGTKKDDLTMEGFRALKAADEVLVRTSGLKSAETLDAEKIAYTVLDFLYEKSRNYDTLAKNIAAEVKRRGRERNVVYCVDGGASEDRAARLLFAQKGVRVIEGRSKAADFAARAGLEGYTALSAFDLEGKKTALPLVVYDLTEDNVSDVKLCLAERYGDEAPAMLFCGEGKKIPLYEADRHECPEALVLYDTPLLEKKRFDLDDFLAILRLLRAPDGCPWDRVQTHESIRINAIEEAYELVDAIDLDDPDKIREEAGDVIMQAAFHTVMEEERGNFDMTDVLSEVCLKLITRHTHVFGKDKASGAEGALSVWDRNKMKEKGQKTYSDAVNDVPKCFPALLRAQKIAKRVEKGGWDEPSFENFERQFREEYEELKKAVKAGDANAVMEEMGDLLMCIATLGRVAGVDCELALLDTVKKVQARYTAYEALVRADGKDVLALSEAEKDAYYARVKNAEKS